MSQKKRYKQRRTSYRLASMFAAGLVVAITTFDLHAQTSDDDTADSYYEDATRRFSEGNTAAGIIQLRNALQLNNGHMPSMLKLGQTLLETGEASEAILLLNDALLLGVDPEQVIPDLADAYLSARSFGELLRTLQPSDAPRSIRAEVYAARAQAFLAQGRTAEAGEMLTEAGALDTQNFRRAVALSTYHLQRGERGQALEVSEALIQRAPEDTRSWSAHASALHSLGRLDEAAEAYATAIEKQTGNVEARIALIDLHMERGRESDAQPHIAYLRTNYPDEPRAAYYSALLAARAGDREKEKDELAVASSLFAAVTDDQMRSNPQLLMLAALSNYGAGAYETASKYADDYLKMQPEDAGALRLKASTLLALGDASSAIRTLLPQNQRNPGDTATALLLATAYSEEGSHKRAEELLLSIAGPAIVDDRLEQQLALARLNAGSTEQGIADLERLRDRNSEQPGIDSQLAVAYLRGNRPDDALAILDAMPDERSATASLQNLRAMALSALGERAAAESLWMQLLEASPEGLELLLNLSLSYMQTGRYDEASDLLTRAQEAHPESARALVMSTRLQLRQGSPESALRDGEKALVLAPGSDEAAWQIIRALLALDKPDEAQEVARKFAARNSESLAASTILGKTFELTGDPAQARLVYTQMSRNPDLSAEELFRIAGLQRNAGAPESAELSLSFALERNPDYRAARLELASVQLQLERFEEAEQTARAQLAVSPEDAAAWLLAGKALLAQEKISAAANAFEKSVAGGEVVLGSIALYRARFSSGQPDVAEAALMRGLELSNGNIQVQAALTDLLIAQQRWKEAETALTQLLQDLPDSAAHLNNRAYVRQQLSKLESAETDARRALELRTDYAEANDTLGWILVEAERPLEALPFLREAMARMGSNPSVRFHLAQVLADLGRTQEALNELYFLLEEAGDFSEKQQALALQRQLHEE